MNTNSCVLTQTGRAAILCLAALVSAGVSHGQMLPSTQVKTLTASAKTSADHMKLAKHYEAVAARHEEEAKQHDALAEQYTKHPTGHEQKHPMSGQTAAHCKYYADHCRKAAESARGIAAGHAEMAKQNGK
ncbi:MAG: hypothetical protein H7039_02035 [Bryobacteraceae bacterium]|nr:hypothetical protein [Bryobacteraceae bacterium]